MSRRVTGALSGILHVPKAEEADDPLLQESSQEQGQKPPESPPEAPQPPAPAPEAKPSSSSSRPSKPPPPDKRGTTPAAEEESYFGLLKDEVKRKKTAEQEQSSQGKAPSPQDSRTEAWMRALGDTPLFPSDDDLPAVKSPNAKTAEAAPQNTKASSTSGGGVTSTPPSKAPHHSSSSVGKRPPVDRPSPSVKHPRTQEAAQTEQAAAVAEQIQKDPFEDLPRVGLRQR